MPPNKYLVSTDTKNMFSLSLLPLNVSSLLLKQRIQRFTKSCLRVSSQPMGDVESGAALCTKDPCVM